MTKADFLERLLDDARAEEDDERVWEIINAAQDVLLSDPDYAAALVRRVGEPTDEADPAAVMALDVLLNAARMAVENRRRRGQDALDAAEAELAALSTQKTLGAVEAMLVAGCFARAGLPTPQALRDAEWLDAALERSTPSDDGPDLDGLLDMLRDQAGTEAFGAYISLNEVFAGFPPALRAPIVAKVIARQEEVFGRIGSYWLLDQEPDIRAAAAAAFLERSRRVGIDPAVRARFVMLRSWMPADAARAGLDAVIAEATRAGASGAVPAPAAAKRHRILASVPDGAGAQTFAVSLQTATGRRSVAVALVKQGFGVQDAYDIPCESASEQRRLLSEVLGQVPLFDVSEDHLRGALAAGLAENATRGVPPAHGLIDVVERCALAPLRPEARDLAGWIEACDPDGDLAALAPAALGRLVNAASGSDHITQSWFEDNDDIQERLNRAMMPRAREKAMWAYLAERRDWWALIFARAASTLKSAGEERWRAFAATAYAMEKGRPNPKVPLMRAVFERSLSVADDAFGDLVGAIRALGAGDLPFEDPPSAPPAAPPFEIAAPAAEKKGELKRLLKAAGGEITPDWIDGYLTAVVVAPRQQQPGEWVGALMNEAGVFPDEETVERFLDILMLRYNRLNVELSDREGARGAIPSRSAKALQDWAGGFHLCECIYSSGWRSPSLRKDDKAMLKRIAGAADGVAPRDELLPLLPTWLARRHSLRE